MQRDVLTDTLMARLRPQLLEPLSSGAPVKTPRGYGVVVDGIDPSSTVVLVELDGDGIRAPFSVRDLQMAEA